ncbi:MAG: tetratricopeptide repeat-containing sensor histidine kinase [Bacteroidetes bacterium]|nr:tetratricopeptide repeat-containing sensor histidine kinase [Bacteroidota bacterium]MBI3482141.1 tetratricopeptide repeat-containing sensor histidine kinase [Bacteroidota bacterium]
MTRRILYFVFALAPALTVAQNLQKIDSLKKKLPHASAEARYKLWNEIAWEFRFAYPDSTLIYAQKAFKLADELQLPADRARALNYQGVAYNYKGERLIAYELYSKALELSTKQKDSTQIAHSNNNIGRLFFEQGLLAKAYDYYVRSYSIFKKLHDNNGLAYTIQSLATLQRTQKDFIQSETNYIEAYNIRLKLHNKRDIISALMMLGRLYYERNEFDKSNASLLKADSICHYINDELIFSEIKLLMAKNFIELNQIDEAEKQAEAGAAVIKRLNYVPVMAETMIALGQIKFLKKNLKSAESYFKSALKIASDIRDLHGQMDAYNHLWKLAEAEHNTSESMQYLNQYLVRKDSIKDLDLTRQVERLQFQLEIEKKEKENEILKMSEAHQATVIAKQRGQNIALFAVLLCVLSMAGALWYYSQKRTRINLKLEAQNQFIDLQRKQIEKRNIDLSTQNHKLADLNHEKDMIMSIVAHDLKSPLSRIMGLSNLLTMEGTLSPSQQEYVRLMKDVTQSNLDLIGDLLDVNALQTENEIPYAVTFNLGELLEERVAFFQHSSISKKIDLQLNHSIDNTIASNPGYITRIIDNLLSNAIKFSKSESVVNVSAQINMGALTFSVKDDGPGFSDGDKKQLYQRFKKLSARPTGGESSNGLGLAIVKTLVERLHGEINLESQLGKGSEFIIRIPVKVVENISA